MKILKLAVLSLAVVLLMAVIAYLGLWLGGGTAVASPPLQGFSQDCVVQEAYGVCRIYRFRDGPRVCYWGKEGVGSKENLAISCVESP